MTNTPLPEASSVNTVIYDMYPLHWRRKDYKNQGEGQIDSLIASRLLWLWPDPSPAFSSYSLSLSFSSQLSINMCEKKLLRSVPSINEQQYLAINVTLRTQLALRL